MTPWRQVFDDGLRETAEQLKARPDDLDLFVKGIATYHMVVEGFLAVTGQKFIREWFDEHGMYPGFVEGFGLVERDEHRHIAFGMRFLSDAVAEDATPPADDRGRGARPGAQGRLRVRAALRRRSPPTSSATATTRRRSTATRTPRSSAACRCWASQLPPPEEMMPGRDRARARALSARRDRSRSLGSVVRSSRALRTLAWGAVAIGVATPLLRRRLRLPAPAVTVLSYQAPAALAIAAPRTRCATPASTRCRCGPTSPTSTCPTTTRSRSPSGCTSTIRSAPTA